MPTTLTKPVLLDETGQEIVDKLDDIKEAIGTSAEFIPLAIRITTPPTKTAYRAGERLDLSGMVVNLVASNGSMIDVTQACTTVPANGATLTGADTSVAVSYLYQVDNLTFTSTQALTVSVLDSIAVTTPPTNTDYSVGDTLDLTGIVVTATYSDNSTRVVTGLCTYSPADGATLTSSNSSITITLSEGGVTKTTSQAISVKELTSIAVTTPPTTTEYILGEHLDLTGIVVTATYDDSSTLDVTAHCVYSPSNGAVLGVNDTTITISYTKGSVTKTATQSISVIPVYGAEWGGTASSAWTRTDGAADFVNPNPYYSGMSGTPSSPFDTIQPWAGMVRVEDNAAGSLVAIPKFYYKLTENGSRLKIQISPQNIDGFHVSPAHMDRGDGYGERDTVYIGRYHCASSTFKSTTGVKPQGSVQRSNCRTSIHNLGTEIWQGDFALRFTIWMLYLVEFADWNSQAVIGYGCSDSGAIMNMGYTDNMGYHTGTMASSRTSYGGTQYRYIEGLWDNVTDWLDGCYNINSPFRFCIIINPSNFDDTNGGISVGEPSRYLPTSFDVVDVSGTFPLFIPKTSETWTGSTNFSEYACDLWMFPSNETGTFSSRYVAGGALPDQEQVYGLFGIHAIGSSGVGSSKGSRLMKLPNS